MLELQAVLLNDAAHPEVHLLGQQLVAMPLCVVVGGSAHVPLGEHDPRLCRDGRSIGRTPRTALGGQLLCLCDGTKQPVRASAALEVLGVSSSPIDLAEVREEHRAEGGAQA